MKQQELQEENPNRKPVSVLYQEMNLGDLNTIGFGTKSLMDDDGKRFFVIVKAQYCLKMISIVEYC